MTAMEYAIRDACDGDRRPNAAREMLTVEECIRAYSESDGYAHPHDRIDRLGWLFVALRLHEKYGITFERYLELVERGEWQRFVDERLEEWVRSEIESRKLWSFLEHMGSEGGRYHTGYLQALEDVQSFLKGGESTMTNDKTAEKLLREQLALLAERSKYCPDELLPSITAAMVEIYKSLKESNR